MAMCVHLANMTAFAREMYNLCTGLPILRQQWPYGKVEQKPCNSDVTLAGDAANGVECLPVPTMSDLVMFSYAWPGCHALYLTTTDDSAAPSCAQRSHRTQKEGSPTNAQLVGERSGGYHLIVSCVSRSFWVEKTHATSISWRVPGKFQGGMRYPIYGTEGNT